MSEKLGPVGYKVGEARDPLEQRDCSEHTAQVIVEEMEKKAEEILRPRQDQLKAIAQALVIHETLTNEEIDTLLQSSSDRPGEVSSPEESACPLVAQS